MKFKLKPLEVAVVKFNPEKRYNGLVITADDLRNPANKSALNTSNASTYNVAKRLIDTNGKLGAVNVAKLGRDSDWVVVAEGDFVVTYPNGTNEVFNTETELEKYLDKGE